MIRATGEGNAEVGLPDVVALHMEHVYLIGWADNDMRTVEIAGQDSIGNVSPAFGRWPER